MLQLFQKTLACLTFSPPENTGVDKQVLRSRVASKFLLSLADCPGSPRPAPLSDPQLVGYTTLTYS